MVSFVVLRLALFISIPLTNYLIRSIQISYQYQTVCLQRALRNTSKGSLMYELHTLTFGGDFVKCSTFKLSNQQGMNSPRSNLLFGLKAYG